MPNVTADHPIAEVPARVRSEIDRHFKLVLNRPEILNRIGDNIVVFDFIRPPIAQAIFDGMVRDVLDGVAASQRIAVSLGEGAHATLAKLCLSDLSNGGRGIRNKVEAHLVNPLARALFDSGTTAGSSIAVDAIDSEEGGVTQLRLGASTGNRDKAA